MYGFVLQDWITIRASAITAVVQSESAWMPFSSFQDMVFWVDVREVTPPSTGSIVLNFETSPTKDDNLFQSMANTGNLAVATPITPLPKVILASGPAVPLATWVRWKLTPNGSASTWDCTFRVMVAANMVGRGQTPQQQYAGQGGMSQGRAAPQLMPMSYGPTGMQGRNGG
jgi:hypothetical protein